MSRTTLAGRSGYWYSMWMLRLAVGEVVLCIFLALAFLAQSAGIIPRTLLFIIIAVFAVNAIAVCALWVVGEVRQRREVHAGYTTVFDSWTHVEQVDDRTGGGYSTCQRVSKC